MNNNLSLYCWCCEDEINHTWHDSEQDGCDVWNSEIWVCDVCENIVYKEDIDSNGDR